MQSLSIEVITAHRSVVVADTSRLAIARNYGVQTHQERLAMPSMRAKIAAQVAGLGVGWLPLEKVRQHLKKGTLVALEMQDPREPNLLFVGWHSHRAGPALQCWGRSCAIRGWWRRCCTRTTDFCLVFAIKIEAASAYSTGAIG